MPTESRSFGLYFCYDLRLLAPQPLLACLCHQLADITNTSPFFGILYFAVTTIISFLIFYFLQNLRFTVSFIVFFNISSGILKTVTHQIIVLKIILLK